MPCKGTTFAVFVMRWSLLFCCNILCIAATAQQVAGLDARLARWRSSLPALGPEAVLDSCARALGQPAHPAQVAALHSLQGSALRMAGRLEEALAQHRHALRLRLRHLGERHEETANSYQNIANCYFNFDSIAKAKACYLRSLAIKKRIFKPDDAQMIPLYNNLGNCFQRDQNADRAVFYLSLALKAGEKAFGPESPRLLETLGYLGGALSIPAPEKAITFLQRAIGIGESGRDTAALALLYNNLGVAQLSRGAFPDARAAFEQGLRFYGALPNPDPTEYGNCWQNKGSALLRLRDADGALLAFKNAGALFRSESDRAALLQNMGLAYRHRGEAARAIDVLNEALNLCPPEAPTALRTGILVNLGDAYLDLRASGNTVAALHYYQQALSEARGTFTARCWNKIGLARLDRKEYAAAAAAFQKALASRPEPAVAFAIWINQAQAAGRQHLLARMGECLSAAATSLGNRGMPEQYPYEKAILLAMEATWRHHIARQSGLASEWQLALDQAMQAIDQAEGLKQYQQEETAFWVVRDDFYEAYSVAVAAFCALERQEEAFAMTERAKDYLFKRLLGKGLSTDKLNLPALPEIQALLHTNQTLLAYHWGVDRIFTFMIRGEGLSVVSIPTDTILPRQIVQFFESCTNPPDRLPDREQEAAYQQIADLGYVLFRRLVAPLSLRSEEDLLIAPDAGLHYLPFEALLTAPVPPQQATRCRSHPYLMRRFSIAYVHSAAVFVALRRKAPSAAANPLLVMAPDFTHNRRGLQPLLHNQEEGKMVAQMSGGDLFSGTQAQKDRFVREAAQYRMLYLATHGEAFDQAPERSFLAFSEPPDSTEDGLLRVRDLDTLHLDADLGVLSACRTAIGRLYRGEGFLSITRTLQAIGIRAVVASLWNVDDQQSPKLMGLLVQGLNQGLSKSQALTQAKCTYIDRASHIKAHPFYWAGLLCSGDERPLPARARPVWLYIGSILFGLAVLNQAVRIIRARKRL